MKSSEHWTKQISSLTSLEREMLAKSLTPKSTKYIPILPHPKQIAFLLAPQREILFGGAAGGGKSEALLAAALQYVDVPGYSAILFRRTFRDLALPGALMERSHQWLDKTDARWSTQDYQWRFPSGATLQFGYLEKENDKHRYQSAQFQMVGFDELTQFSESQYRYLFSRLRRLETSDIPIRMRAATNPGGCVPEGDVLTPTGFKPIQNLQIGDPIYTVQPDGRLTETQVARTYVYQWDDDLISVNARGLTMLITPDHRVAKTGGTRTNPQTPYTLVPFDQLPGQATILRTVTWEGTHLDKYTPDPVPTRQRKLDQPLTLHGDLYLQLLGWVISEGHTVTRDREFAINQKKPEHRDTIRDLLDECGFTYRETPTSFMVSSPEWSTHFSQFGLCRDKHLPASVKQVTTRQLQLLIGALMAGDGHWRSTNGGTYYTTSRQLADDMAEIALKAGYLVYTHTRQRDNREGPTYEISIKKTLTGGTELLTGQHVYQVDTTTRRSTHITRIPHHGKVYCIGVEGTQTFVIRQRGSIWVSGNSGHEWVKRRFIGTKTAPVIHPQRIFIPSRLEDNPSLDLREYEEALAELDPVTRAQLRAGDWDIDPRGGKFQRHWFNYHEYVPETIRFNHRIRYWDLASTSPKPGEDPDYTVGTLLAVDQINQYWVLDVVRFRGTPAENERIIYETAQQDGVGTEIWMEQEMGSSGKSLISHYRRNILLGYQFRGHKPSGNKEVRAMPVSAVAEEGDLHLVTGEWTEPWLDELAVFPEGAHDDQVDSLSGAHYILVRRIKTEEYNRPAAQRYAYT